MLLHMLLIGRPFIAFTFGNDALTNSFHDSEGFSRVQSFMNEVCKQNVKRLSDCLKSGHSISPERKMASESLIRTLKGAIKTLTPIISRYKEQYSAQEDSNDLPEAWVEDYLLIMSQLQGKRLKMP